MWLAGSLASCVSVFGAEAPVPQSFADFKIPLWYETTTVRGGFGYKDNVLLSSSNPRGSALWTAGGDIMVYRLPSHGWQFHCLASFDNVGYFDRSVGVGNEQVGMAAAQVTQNLGRDWKLGLGANYLYQDQVFDMSVTQTNEFTIGEVLGHNLAGRWSVRKDFRPYWLEVEASLTRQWLAAPLDGFGQTGPRLTLGRSYGRGSDVTLTYQWIYVAFDKLEQVSADGYAQPGTRLRFQAQTAELAWRHGWGQQGRWRIATTVGLDLNEDNASGYFDFWRYRLAEQVKYRAKTWEISAQFRIGHYDFPVQPVSFTVPTKRTKTMLAAGVRAEKTLRKSFRIFGSYAYEHSISNVSYDRYQTSTTSAGVEYRF